MLLLLNKYKKEFIALLVVLLAFGGGWLWAKSTIKPDVVEKIQIKQEVVEKVVEKIVEVEKKDTKGSTNTHTTIVEKPDGTKETTIDETTNTETHESSNTTTDIASSTDVKTEENKETSTTYKKSSYRIGVFAESDFKKFLQKDQYSYGGTASARLGNLPLWVDGMYNFDKKTFGLGISLEF